MNLAVAQTSPSLELHRLTTCEHFSFPLVRLSEILQLIRNSKLSEPSLRKSCLNFLHTSLKNFADSFALASRKPLARRAIKKGASGKARYHRLSSVESHVRTGSFFAGHVEDSYVFVESLRG